jgi:hypothetical protein
MSETISSLDFWIYTRSFSTVASSSITAQPWANLQEDRKDYMAKTEAKREVNNPPRASVALAKVDSTDPRRVITGPTRYS